MNEIRKQNDQEKEIATLKFDFPIVLKVFTIMAMISGIVLLILPFTQESHDHPEFYIPGIILFFLSIFLLQAWIDVSKFRCVITSKRIYGSKVNFFGLETKTYSFRIDRIDAIAIINTFRINIVRIIYSNGNFVSSNFWGIKRSGYLLGPINEKSFSAFFVSNMNEVAEKVNEFILSIKNDKDLSVDIAMKEIEAEKDKADAISQIANKGSNKQ